MSAKKTGQQTAVLASPPTILCAGNVVGRMEGEGPLAACFDYVDQDDTFGEATWEQSERAMQQKALALALQKGGLTARQLDYLFAGDLLNQCVSSSYAAREQKIPFFGLYGACSTFGEGLILASMALDGGFGERAGVVVSSHFCTAERQYRTPLEYGCQRTPTAQWTVTGAGAVILGGQGSACISAVTFGRVRDLEVKDINNMGAAMAPAAAETIRRYFSDTGEAPAAFDAVYTGDLGAVGSQLLAQLLERDGLVLHNHQDCGLLVFDRATQDVQAGGSGAGCSASVLCCHVLPRLEAGKLRRVLFLSTGALMSQTTFLQGESIPGVAHLVELRCAKEETE